MTEKPKIKSLCGRCVYGLALEGRIIHTAARQVQKEPDDKENWGKPYDPSEPDGPDYETSVEFEVHYTDTVGNQCYWPYVPKFQDLPSYFTPASFTDIEIHSCSRFEERNPEEEKALEEFKDLDDKLKTDFGDEKIDV